MSDFTETPDGVNLDVPADGWDSNFLEQTNKDAGYDPNKEPGQASVTPPEGKYIFRYEFYKNSDEDRAINERSGLPNRWKPGVTKADKQGNKASFIGTTLKANMLRPALDAKLSLEDFDSLGLANRQFFSYISNLMRFGRSSMTDWLNSVLPEKMPVDASIRQDIEVAEELLQGVPEGVGLVTWALQWKDESEEDTKKQFKDLRDLGAEWVTYYKGGTKSKNWPKDEDGSLKTSWKLNLTQQRAWDEKNDKEESGDESVQVFVRAELRDFMPFEAEEE